MAEDMTPGNDTPLEPTPAEAADDAVESPDLFAPDESPEPAFANEPPAAPQPPAPPAPPQPTYAPPSSPQPTYTPPAPPQASYSSGSGVSSDKSKVAAGVLAILLGGLGVHKFYLGYTKEGVILLAVTLVSFGMLAWVSTIVGIIEGVIYLTKTDEDFDATYVALRSVPALDCLVPAGAHFGS